MRYVIAISAVIVAAPVAFVVMAITGPFILLGVWWKALIGYPGLLKQIYQSALQHAEIKPKE